MDDPEPKVPDTTKPVIAPISDVKAKENAAIAPIQVNVTDDSNQAVKVSIAGQPTGVSYNEMTKQIEGTPVVSDWGEKEETRDFTITVTATDLSGNTATIDFVITVLRDTDNDGIPDIDDPDDDNDGIPDVDDPEPKVPDTTKPVIAPISNVKAMENAAITPIQVVVMDDSNQPVKVSIDGQPEGISYNETEKKIEGTPTINDWSNAEETRDFTITVTATDLSGNTAIIDFVMTVLRDTDNDGIPDVDDPDDDNDGIPDVDDPEPKVPDTTKPVIAPISDVKAKENAAIAPISVVVTDDSNQAVKVSITGQPTGVSYNETDKQIEGTPTINDWGEKEETRDFTITVTATDLSSNTATIDFMMTVLRDTDNDGISDIDDPDDDNDGIPDVDDPEPKVPDTTKPVITPISDVKAKENAAIAPISVVVTDDSNQAVKVSIAGQPTGVSYNETDKQIEGTPTINDWGTAEETRDFTITVTATDLSGNTATIDFVMTVLRDTDNDGIPDVDDPDDDNDGIPDVDDLEPKVPDTTKPVIAPISDVKAKENTAITPIQVDVTDDSNQQVKVSIDGQPDGISYNETDKQIEGTPTINDWGEKEETRDFTITVTATDLSGNTATIDFVMTVLRDTDNDGIPDVEDPDDDNDGIPDVDDPEPKVPDTTKPVITPIADVKAKENAAIAPIAVVVTDDSNQPVKVSIDGQPEGITYNETEKKIEGTPTINDWGTAEETRDYTITVTATDMSGNTSTIDFVMTVLRDTDNDGIPDVDDPDDDNDGIPDVDDPEPKVPDTTKPVISPISDVKAKENAAIAPIQVNVTDDSNQPVKVSIDGQPAGVSYNETTKQIEGTPTINDWGTAEETRDYTVTVTATDLSGNTSTIDFVMTVLRDTDGDGIPDVDDPDDDNDGIPDVDDPEPKVPDTTKPVITPIADVKAKENAAITPIQVAVTDDSNQAVKVSIDGQPEGVSYNEANKQIEGTPVVSDWGTVEETRDFTVTVTANDISGNTSTIDFVMTVLRDTDNDCIPDVDDPDDDNDGIPDVDDPEPKVPDTAKPVIAPISDVKAKENAAITPIQVNVTDDSNQPVKVSIAGQPNGISYNEADKKI